MIDFNILIPYSFGQISITVKYLISEFKFENMILRTIIANKIKLFFVFVPFDDFP